MQYNALKNNPNMTPNDICAGMAPGKSSKPTNVNIGNSKKKKPTL